MTALFRKLSIRRKQVLIIMFTTTVALLLACSAFVFYDVVDFRAELVERIASIAEVIAEHSTAALDFSDTTTAEQTLQALSTESEVDAGCMYDRDGHVFAEYTRDGRKFTPPAPRAAGHEFSGGHMGLFQPVKEGSEIIGTIYVESDLKELPQRMQRYAAIAGLVFVIALAVALVLSSRLHRVLSNPILHVAKIARLVAVEKNYSVRAKKTSEDELGQLVDGFNEMLAQIQQRESALQAARDTLENRVDERTNELANSLSLLNATLNSTEDGILAVDLGGRAICYNEQFPAMWAMPQKIIATGRNEAFIEHCATMVDDPRGYFLRIQELMLQPEKAAHDILSLRDGRYFERVIHPQLMNGRCIGRVLMFRDITERKRAESNLQKANAELVQASRRAGMAEIATNVLHNVGNVLNSVNTSAAVVMDQVRVSKLSGISRVVEMLEPNAHDLAGFFARDARGPQMVEYLKTLSNFLGQEQDAMLKELTSLTKNIEHIKQIVAMQQSYAKASGVEEIHSPVALMEDALRIHLGSLEKYSVKIIRDYEKVPDVIADKHKVLQILINLIGNAKYALVESEQPEPQTIIGVKANGGSHLYFTVRDNGVGIASENLIRIFSHGFTTRRNGHGFGLHSGFLAAKEMGGSLSVHSDGPGCGAVFTLELPIKPRTKV
jgi:C4-dicarboxylate-specific signal transduction histidine kinase